MGAISYFCQMKMFLIACLLLLSCAAFGQQRNPPPASTNTSHGAEVSRPQGQKNYWSIYRRQSKGTLSGNKCVEDQTMQMGFRYVLLPKKGPGSRTGVGIALHNFGTRFLLFFRNGPFWQCRIKKKIKECRRKTGDYMG